MSDTLPCNKSDVLFIRWKDAVGQSTRGDPDELCMQQLARNWNVGWILHENDERIILCHGTSTSGEVDYLQIAKADVVEVVPLIRRAVRKPKVTPDAGTDQQPSGDK